jgi:hypothetical protein
MNTGTSKVRKLSAVVALGAGLLAITASRTASATPTSPQTCSPTGIDVNSGYTLIQCVISGALTNFLIKPSTSCGAGPSSDIYRTWLSLAQAALLAGKNLTIYFVPACGSDLNVIYDMSLSK